MTRIQNNAWQQKKYHKNPRHKKEAPKKLEYFYSFLMGEIENINTSGGS